MATWAGVVGGSTGGTGNTSPIPLEWDETDGQMMIMVASQARGLASGQTQDEVSWSIEEGWLLVSAVTMIDPYTSAESSFLGSWVSQAIFLRLGTTTTSNRTADLVHTGTAGGNANVSIYGVDDAAPFVSTFWYTGYAANPTDYLIADLEDALYVSAYADSSGATPTYANLRTFTEVERSSGTRLGRARAYLFSEGGRKGFPSINGANINESRNEFPWIYHMILFGNRGKTGWFRGHPWG